MPDAKGHARVNERERWLANVERRGDGFVPCTAYVGAWGPPGTLEDGITTVDAWGSTWQSTHPAVRGEVTRPALRDVSLIERYQPPDLLAVDDLGNPVDWQALEQDAAEKRERGEVVEGRGGRLYDRAHFLRGFEEFLVDVALDADHLERLCEMIAAQNLRLVRRWLAVGVDLMSFMDDLGMQDRLQVSPDAFRRRFLPAYARLFGECRDAGVHVLMHTNGRVVPIIGDLIDAGATMLSLQDRVNGIDEMAREIDGRVCLRLNLDVQTLIRFGTPEEIDQHIRRCIEELGSPQGGLELIARGAPGTPPANVEALEDAFAKYQGHWPRAAEPKL